MKIWLSNMKASVWLVGLVTLVSCYDAQVEKPFTKTTQTTNVRVAQNKKDSIDLLFVIDNSPSTKPKQEKLKANFKDLIGVLDQFKATIPANYHIGVITSDMGLPVGGYSKGGCLARPGRNTDATSDPLKKDAAVSGGRLVRIGEAAAANCATVTGGANFIEYDQRNNTNNLPGGAASLDTTFQCMASVGDKGCGIEAPLEAAYVALGGEGNVPAGNDGFLREGAVLFVVFITDEDDCSLDPQTPIPASNSLFEDKRYAKNPSYLCPRFGITCNGQNLTDDTPISGLQNCTPIMGITESRFKQTEVKKYIDFFNRGKSSGGVKNDPKDVYVVSLSAPSSGTLESIYADFNIPTGSVVTRPYKTCTPPGMQNPNNSCVMAMNSSCSLAGDTSFAGDPAVRLNYVVEHVTQHQTSTICADNYQSALQNLGNLIITSIKPGCITSPFENPDKPDCLAQDITRTATGNTTTLIPWCGKNHELVQGKTCWMLETKNDMSDPLKYCDPVYLPTDTAKANPQQFGIKIDRVGDPPPNTSLAVACDTLPIAGGN